MYHIYTVDRWGKQNHGSVESLSTAFHHVERLRYCGYKNAYVSDHREGLTRLCRCGNPVWGKYGEWSRCYDCIETPPGV